jgi:hypothetical protein
MTTGAAARSHVLQTAERLVNNERNTQYDEPSADFARTAGMWTAYLGIPISMADVAMCMVLLKVARVRFAPEHVDNYYDIAGYGACGADVAGAVDVNEYADSVQFTDQYQHGDECQICVANRNDPTSYAQGEQTGGYRWQERPEGAR